MKQSLLLFGLLFSFASFAFAQDAKMHASVDELQATIQAELQAHGDRVMGNDTIHWSTRMDKFEGCRAQFSVHVRSTFGGDTDRVETVSLSIGALEPYGIGPKKSWLELPCAGREKCVFSTSTCSRKEKNGMITNCATASQKRVETFLLQLDGDPTATAKLERVFREAAIQCREPKAVTF